jgi:hypothetical protein
MDVKMLYRENIEKDIERIKGEFLVDGKWVDSRGKDVPVEIKEKLCEWLRKGDIRKAFESDEKFVRLLCSKCGREMTLIWKQGKQIPFSSMFFDLLDDAFCGVCEGENR